MHRRRTCLRAIALIAIGTTSALGQPGSQPLEPSELIRTIRQADRIVVMEHAGPRRTLYSSGKQADISALANAIVVDAQKGLYPCPCLPVIDLFFTRLGKDLGSISVDLQLTIAYSRWPGNVRLSNPEKFLRWFDARGITAPRRNFEALNAMEKTLDLASERWLRAVPSALQPLWKKAR